LKSQKCRDEVGLGFGLREGWAFHSKNWEIRSKQHKRIPPGSILMYPSSLGLYTVSNTFLPSFARGRPGAMICEEFAFWLQSYLCHSLIRQSRPMYLGRRVLSNLLLGWNSWTSRGLPLPSLPV
jgi:hypothetical protein